MTPARLVLLLALVSAIDAARVHPQAMLRPQPAKELHNPLERIVVSGLRKLYDPSIKLEVNSTVLEHTGQWFEVSWSGVAQPSVDDWIALWVPHDADFSKTAPAKYKLAALSPKHFSEGSGSVRFRLISYRHDMVFAFLRKGFLNPVVAAVSPIVRVAHPNQPLQGHLALTGKSDEMQIQWVTKNSSKPVVRWGTKAGRYDSIAEGRSFTYGRDEMCGEPATTIGWVEPGTQHTAVMTGLEPGRQYFYTYGDEAHGFAPEASFRTPPPVGPTSRVKLLAVADMGQSEVDGSMEQSQMQPSLNTTNGLIAEGDDYQMLIHNGDISYARGYVTQWDNFFSQIEPLTRRMPYMTTPGNHERDYPRSGDRFNWGYDSGGECGVAYERRLVMPIAGRDKPWYSFDMGPLHFLQYSTEHEFAPGSEQYAFIKSDLESVDRSRTPWVVVGGHRPIYISSNNVMQPDGDQTVAAALRAALEPLLLEHHVDMTWHGHHHSYQRTCPVYNGTCRGYDEAGVARGPVHLVIGHAGAFLSLNVDVFHKPIWEVIRLWWGYMRVDATGTHLKCEVVSDLDGSLMDSITLKKPVSWGEEFMQHRGRRHGGRVVS